MSLEALTSRNGYLGTSALHVYAYSFYILLNTHLRVTVEDTDGNETTLTLTTDYTVSGVGHSSGGNVTLVNASQAWLTAGELTTGYTLTIRRVLPLTQIDDIRNQETFYPETHENAFDKAIMIDQQQQDEIDRSLKLPVSIDPDDFDMDLPADIVEAASGGKVLIVNDTYDGFSLADSSEILNPSVQMDYSMADGAGPSDLDGQTVDSAVYSSAHYMYEVQRGTDVFSSGTFSLHYRDGAWEVAWGEERMQDGGSEMWVNFSTTGTTIAQLQAEVYTDAGRGDATIKLRRYFFSA